MLLPHQKSPLTRRQTRLADYFLQYADEVVFMIVAQLAETSSVSDNTLVCQAQALGLRVSGNEAFK
ncbi:MAG: hypothetical protein V1844_11680 [Pseudomonadota bacterium]